MYNSYDPRRLLIILRWYKAFYQILFPVVWCIVHVTYYHQVLPPLRYCGNWTCYLHMKTCRKTCLVGLLNRSILSAKNCTSASDRGQVSSVKSNESTGQQNMFCFNHTSAYYTSNNIVKNVDEYRIKAGTSTGNPTGNTRCHRLTSRALNMSRSFGQSAHSIESRCVVIHRLLHRV